MALPTTFDEAYAIVSGLVDDFKQNEKFFLNSEFNEAEARNRFITQFFNAFGWDMYHHYQKNPYEQEVRIEKGEKISGAQKRADYAFSLSPHFNDTKFYVEAKSPSAGVNDKDSYFQTIRYGWHKSTPLAVLTSFYELHIIDCRYAADINTVLSRKISSYHYTDYKDKEKFAEIYYLFSREAVENLSLEKRAETLPKPKGKAVQKALFPFELHQTIDTAFLKDIEEKREILAKAFKKNDESLTSEELTEATQKTIDRLVFIRFLEDKLIEQEHYVDQFGERNSSWIDFINVCKKLDAKYNGIVFKKSFIDDPNKFNGPVDSEFHKICQDICHLNSRFLFNEIPIDILGSIYERFLGKVVHATDHRVKIEEKPEVRKAGGVYYTPKYIVDYIVDKSVGKQIESKSPEQISKLKFADIACGSGSFLIGVYDKILQYHKTFYQKNPDKAKKDGCYFKDGKWILSIKQKQNILLNNIFGVDIDSQAVEVTQLSLSLKMLEDETTATANDMQVLFHQKILPDMSKNIVCGNSLIGSDVFNNDLFNSVSEDEKRLNPMDYETTFSNFKTYGGFDCIVGNPPYIFTRDKGISPIEKDYYYSHYNFQSAQLNTFGLFVERAFKKLKTNGAVGYIIPNNWLSIDTFSILRKFILEQTGKISIVNILGKVFQDASVDTCILIFSKAKGDVVNIGEMTDKKISYFSEVSKKAIKPPQYIFQINLLKNSKFLNIIDNIEKASKPLSEYATVSTGVKVYQTGKGVPKQTDHAKKNRTFHSTTAKNKNYIKYLEGSNVSRYHLGWSGEYLNYGEWIAEPRKSVPFEGERILIRQIPSKPPYMVNGIFTTDAYINDINSMVVFAPKEIDLKFLLGCLNSKLISFWFDKKYDKLQRKIFPQFKVKELAMFPIPKIDLKNKVESANHNKLIKLVEQNIDTKISVQKAKTDKDLSYYSKRIQNLDSQIDTLVYELFGMSEEEIEIIEK